VIWLAACLILAATLCSPPAKINNSPIQIPADVAYVFRSIRGANTVTVIDMDRDSIVGIQEVAVDDEVLWDMALGPDGMLYFTECWKDFDYIGDVIRVFNPGKGVMVGDIAVAYDPMCIYDLPDGRAVIAHEEDDSTFATTIIQMAARKVDTTLRLVPDLNQVLISPDSESYLFYAPWTSSFPKGIMYRLDPQVDTLAAVTVFDDTLMGYGPVFGTSDKIYSCFLGSVKVHEFPSGSFLKEIGTDMYAWELLAPGNGRVYVANNTDEAWQSGNYDSLSIIDAGTDEIVKTIQVCKGPQSMAYSKALNKIYVAGQCGTTISVIDPDRDSVTKTIVSNLADVNTWGYQKIVVNH
jgi:YVTN family beta-propeller protein